VYLNQPVSNPENIGKKLFNFSPEIKGEAVFVNERQIEFRPSEPLLSGTVYSAEFLLGEIMKPKRECKKCRFSFQPSNSHSQLISMD
jgi:alpha-2-macroglobulin